MALKVAITPCVFYSMFGRRIIMVDVKLTKTEEQNKLYYLVQDKNKKDTCYDYFEFPRYKDMPNLETACFKIMAKELMKYTLVSNYTTSGFKNHLFLFTGLLFEENKIDLSTLKVLLPVVTNIRFKTLYNTINRFRALDVIDKVDFYKDEILKFTYDEFTDETKKLIDEAIKNLALNKDRNELTKEIVYLSLKNEYERAIIKAKHSEIERQKRDEELQRIWEEYDLENVELQEEDGQ